MKIKVRGIPQAGLEASQSIEPSEIGLSEEELTCLLPLDITVKAERISNAVVIQAEVKVKLSFSCSRCLEDVEKDSVQNFKFEYEVDKNTEIIDIGEDIRQELLLNIPQKVLCREDCQGICLHCGANLNEEECQCGK